MDTSVTGGCEDTKFRKYSCLLFEASQQEKAIMVISDVTREELLWGPKNVTKIPDQVPEAQSELFVVTEQARKLANAYISSEAVGPPITTMHCMSPSQVSAKSM